MAEMKKIVNSSIEHGLKVPAVRAIMLAGMFSGGVGIYVFYALQPHLLNLWGNQKAYGIAGLVAALGCRRPDRRRAAHPVDPSRLQATHVGTVDLGSLGVADVWHSSGLPVTSGWWSA